MLRADVRADVHCFGCVCDGLARACVAFAALAAM